MDDREVGVLRLSLTRVDQHHSEIFQRVTEAAPRRGIATPSRALTLTPLTSTAPAAGTR